MVLRHRFTRAAVEAAGRVPADQADPVAGRHPARLLLLATASPVVRQGPRIAVLPVPDHRPVAFLVRISARPVLHVLRLPVPFARCPVELSFPPWVARLPLTEVVRVRAAPFGVQHLPMRLTAISGSASLAASHPDATLSFLDHSAAVRAGRISHVDPALSGSSTPRGCYSTRRGLLRQLSQIRPPSRGPLYFPWTASRRPHPPPLPTAACASPSVSDPTGPPAW